MRPYFAPRPAPPVARAPEPVTADELATAWIALVETTRPHWPGGEPTEEDTAGLLKRICNRFGVTPEAVSAALLFKALSTPL